MTTENISVPEELLSALRRHKRVLIAAHARPDPDAMGSSLAMAWALRSTGLDALVFNEDGLPPFLHFLTLPGPVLTSLASLPCASTAATEPVSARPSSLCSTACPA